MLGTFRNRRAGVLIYALLAALVVGLAGFGIGAGRGHLQRQVARVGDVPVTAEDYVRAMQQELRALTQQTGRSLTMAEARQYGVDRMVLARLVNDAALDGEAAAPRPLHRRRRRARPGDGHPGLPGLRRQLQPRDLRRRPRARRPPPRRLRGAAAPRGDPRAPRPRRPVRRRPCPTPRRRPSSASSASGAASNGCASTPPSCPSRSPRPPTPTSPPSTTPTPPTATPAPRRGRSPTPA